MERPRTAKPSLVETLLALTLASAAVVQAQNASEADSKARALHTQAIKAYQAKDYASFLALEKEAVELDPTSPRGLYNVACGEALTGHPAEAVRRLDQLLTREIDFGAEQDTDFSGIRETPEWRGFQERLKTYRRPVVRSVEAFSLPDASLLPAGIALDPRTGYVYVGSTRKRKIVRRSPSGEVTDFTTEAQDGLLSVASLLVDESRRLLYASAASTPFMVGRTGADDNRAGLFAFDLDTGRLVRRSFLPPDGKTHFLNALAMDQAGMVYVSDSAEAGIYRLAAGADRLEAFVGPELFAATQGLAFSSDGHTLYVADFTDGVWAVDVATKRKSKIGQPSGVWLGGLDGLSRTQDGFVAVQIGMKPDRVVRLRLDAAQSRFTAAETLEINHPAYEGPIQGTIVGTDFLYIANSQLDLVDPKSGALAEAKCRPTVVLRLPLDK